MDIKSRLTALRKAMARNNIDAFIIPSMDAHLSEYTPKRWKGRTWISGFNGSAGTVVVTADKAGLWTDSRYFLQAAEQLKGSTIELYKEAVPGVPTIEQFLTQTLSAGKTVACDGACYAHAQAEALEKALDNFGIVFRTDTDLLEEIWTDRPDIPGEKLFRQSAEYAGYTAKEKIAIVNTELKKQGANAVVVTMLDELAWVFNLRGYDVDFNPVGVAFGFISEKESVLFVKSEKVDDALRGALEKEGIHVRAYESVVDYISGLGAEVKLLVDSKRISEKLFRAIPAHCRIIESVSVITMLKAIKNKTELDGVRNAMVRDGVSLTRFFIWLEKALAEGERPTEYEIGKILNGFRAKGEKFYGDSFGTIAGYKGHGAIVHYEAKVESSYRLEPEGILLLDSGGQYLDGTTDITRTIALGKVSDEIKTDYTLVLKGHIGIAMCQYPQGTRGSQIDILARKPLWDRGLNYGHGTGHGVGCFLNVHEGPQNIRTEVNPTVLEVGMITSNEPGIYRADQYGIRIENLVVTKVNCETEFGKFLGFETLTLCYLDNSLVKKELLTEAEVAWYNEYQEMVYRKLSPSLTKEEAAWLRKKTEKI